MLLLDRCTHATWEAATTCSSNGPNAAFVQGEGLSFAGVTRPSRCLCCLPQLSCPAARKLQLDSRRPCICRVDSIIGLKAKAEAPRLSPSARKKHFAHWCLSGCESTSSFLSRSYQLDISFGDRNIQGPSKVEAIVDWQSGQLGCSSSVF